jgi:catalase
MGQKLRGVHPKPHGCVIADFQINKGISSLHRIGLFSRPGKNYKALIRFSNAAVRIAPDLDNNENGSRGMAIKVFDIDGEMLVYDKGANNQDFLMINTSAFAFPNVRSYQRLTNALVDSPSGSDPRAAFQPAEDWTPEDLINLQKTAQVIKEIKAKTVRNPLEARYFAAAPSGFGKGHVMKFSAEPCGGETIAEDFEDPSAIKPNYLRNALAARMQEGEDVCFDFKVQVLGIDQVRKQRNIHNGKGDLIEDATRKWDEDEFPFVSVAKITIEAPVSASRFDATQQDCESQAFNPWHSLAQHTPLGGINRLRRPVYIGSAANRAIKP